jgi:hypothetical protein
MSTDVVQVLAESRRRELLALLVDQKRTAGEIAARFAVTHQAISQHSADPPPSSIDPRAPRQYPPLVPRAPRRAEGRSPYVDAMWPDALGRLAAAVEREHASGRRDAERN